MMRKKGPSTPISIYDPTSSALLTSVPSLHPLSPKSPPLLNNCTLAIYIPTDAVSAIIGRRGATIAGIQDRAVIAGMRDLVTGITEQGGKVVERDKHEYMTPCRVTIPSVPNQQQQQQQQSQQQPQQQPQQQQQQQQQVVPGPSPVSVGDLWTPCVVRGEPSCCFSVYRSLVTLLGPTDVDGCVLEVPLMRNRHATIIGSKGSTIRKLSADCDVRIAVPGKDEFLESLAGVGGQGGGGGGGGEGGRGHSPPPGQVSGHRGKREIACVTMEGRGEDVERCLYGMLTMIDEGVRKHEMEKERIRIQAGMGGGGMGINGGRGGWGMGGRGMGR
ncbi:hypothetical protein TrCOL_g1521 [Triparma columacea]|uniref:K Homology domain-containing protein n=1 Tax=Triparma columacea TaxID=722753 RepID=A0A9W7LB18_9STRA|nr:hypothetical protein TrCOL_g1521 [Triparma columacea]